MPIMQKPGQRDNRTYPQGKEEVAKARVNLLKMLHSEGIQRRIVQHMQGNPEQGGPALAQLIAMMVVKIIGSIKGKFGSKVHIKLIQILVKLAVSEISTISRGIGVGQMPKEAAKALFNGAMEMVKKMMTQQGGQPGTQQGGAVPQADQARPMMQQGGGLLGGENNG